MIEMGKTFMQTVADYVGRLQNHEFAEAAMAVAAAVIWSDGRIDPAEEAKLRQFIQVSPLLQPFGCDDLLNIFDHFSEMYRQNLGHGLEGVKGAVRRVHDPDQRVLLLKFGLVLAKADDPMLKPGEERVIREFCEVLEVEPDLIFKPMVT